jgi:hypothetical protein
MVKFLSIIFCCWISSIFVGVFKSSRFLGHSVIYPGKLLFNREKMNKSKKNYIKFAMPVAKHTAAYASKCCLEAILSAWNFIKGVYRYEYVFWRLKQLLFSEFCLFHP